jgi:hypothetical protein
MYLKNVNVLGGSQLQVHLSGWAKEYHSTLSGCSVHYEVRTGNLQNISENVDA